MAMIKSQARIEFSVTMVKLTETEARALDALVGYGDDAFLDMFYRNLGKHYMQPHEQGLRQLFETIRREVVPAIKHIDEARRALITSARSK